MAELVASFDPIRGPAALALFGAADIDEPAALTGATLREGLLAGLVQAEFLAAQAGVVPFFDLPDGSKGVLVIGGARASIAKAPEAVRVLYLAAHGAAHTASLFAKPGSLFAKPLDPTAVRVIKGGATEAISLGLGLALTVLGVAAIVATAWYAKGATSSLLTARGEDLRAMSAADAAMKIASARLAAGQPIEAGVFDVFRDLARREVASDYTLPIAAGAVGGALAIGLAWYGSHRLRGAFS